MEAISDFTWMRDLRIGRVLERFDFEDYRVVAVSVPSTEERPLNQFHFRLLFFPKNANRPVLALNLESSILGSYCLTEQSGGRHLNVGRAQESMSYGEFKQWALTQAQQDLVNV